MLEHLHSSPRAPERVVVIGAGGFVGRSVVRRLAADGVACLPVTRKEIDLLTGDAAKTLAGLLRPSDSVVMISAIAPARTPATLVQDLQMAAAVADAVAASPIVHLVYVSSDAVYADDGGPVTEWSCAQPATLHGAMHLAREVVFTTSIKAPVAVLRPSLLYGAGDPHNGYGPNRFRRLVARGEPITLFGEGEELRDHVSVDDVGAIVALALAHRSRGTLNVATGVSVSFRQAAEMAVRLSGRRVEVKGTPRQTPITHRHFDIAACLKAFPSFHYTPLEDGMRRAVLDEREAARKA